MYTIFYSLIFLRFVQTAAYIMLFFFALIKLKEPKRKRIMLTAGALGLVIIGYFSVLIFAGPQIAESLAVPVHITLCLILLGICSADKWQVGVFVMFTQFNFYLAIRYLARLIIPEDVGIMYEIPNLLCRTVLYAALLLFLFKIVRPHFRKFVDNLEKEWNLIALVAVSFYILEAVIQYYPRSYWKEADDRWYLIASSYVLFVLVYWLLFRSTNVYLEKLEVQEREGILAMQNKIWEEQMEDQKMAVNHARRDRHDLRHHYDTLLAMLEGGKTLEAVSYLNAQTARAESVELVGICEHPSANAILSRWEARARASGIVTEIDARIPARLPMDEVALVGVLANAFENAVEGCLRCPGGVVRSISAKVVYSVNNGVGKLHIVFENPCRKDIAFENGLPISEKPGGGTGTKSITYTAERYNGIVEFAEYNGIFRMRILLHMKDQAVT